MKIVRLVVVLAVALSICFCGIYLKFFSTINSYINTYIVQVGIYKQDENANEMIKKLSDLGKPNYKYQKDNNFVVITGVFLDEKEAKDMGNTISESGITCVIKQTKFESSFKEVIEKQDYEAIESLNNIELLALVLRTGNKQESAIELAQRVINEIGGFRYLHDINYYQLIQIKGIKQAKAIEVLAIIEIAKRLDKQPVAMSAIKEPRDGYELLKNQLMFEQQEKVIVLCLNSRLEVIKEKTVFIGGNNISIISGRELFKEALICGSNRVMVVHNHPSGNPEPSIEDIEATERLYSMAKELDIDVVDHLIIGRSRFYSFASNKIIEV